MKKFFAFLFIGSTLTFAACQSKPKTEEATVDSTANATIATDTTMAADTTAQVGVDATGAASTTTTTSTESTTK